MVRGAAVRGAAAMWAAAPATTPLMASIWRNWHSADAAAAAYEAMDWYSEYTSLASTCRDCNVPRIYDHGLRASWRPASEA